MRKIAFYGRGGIIKSTTASTVSAALAEVGELVYQINGASPREDGAHLWQ